MSNFLDPLLFGVRTVVQDLVTYPTRNKLRINGATITDDAANNETIIDIAGGGGGGGTPSSSPGAPVATVGSAGVATTYARGDHVHNLTAAVVQALAAGASAVWNFNSKEITFLGAPLAGTSAARLSDVTAATTASTLHPSVRAIDIGYGPAMSGVITVDGIPLSVGDRYARAADGTNNGIWVVQSGAHTRAADWPAGRVINGDQFVTTQGVDFAGLSWAAYGPPVTVGSGSVSIDTVNRPERLFGDVTGYTYSTRVENVHGDGMNEQVLLTAKSVKHGDSSAATFSKLYQKTSATASTSPLTAITHSFAASVGMVTAVAQVNFMNSAGVAESFHIRETRTYDGATTPVIVGTASTLYEPSTPTGAVTFTWNNGNVELNVQAPTAGSTRWGVNFELFEVVKP